MKRFLKWIGGIVGAFIGTFVLLVAATLVFSGGENESKERESKQFATPKVEELNTRAGPGTDYEKQSTVFEGDKLAVIDSSSGWLQVKMGVDTFWVSGEHTLSWEQHQLNLKVERQRLEDKFGEKPEKLLGSYSEVRRYLRATANDPESIEVEQCTDVYTSDQGWLVGCDYRGDNAFGGTVRQSNWFTIVDGRVAERHDPDAFSVE
jgi:uncharacterized protein YgiM (DUF1202 family)